MAFVNNDTIDASDFVGSNALVQIVSGTGTTLSLTTLANQRVVVMVSGNQTSNGGTTPVVSLRYNAVTKHSVTLAGTNVGFSLMYSEIPGAGTRNITVETTAGTIANVVITAFLLRLS